LPGEKRRSRREMERYIAGYKEVRQELDLLRKTMEQQEKARNGLEKKVLTSFYKSPVGTRTTKSSGALFFIDARARTGFFSITNRI